MSLGSKSIVLGSAGALLALMLLIVFGDNGLMELYRLRARERAVADQNEILARENISLYRTIDRLKHDLLYIESVARNELGMVGKDDLIIIPPADGWSRKKDGS